MKLLNYLFAIPLAIVAVWAIYGAESSAEGISFLPWAQECLHIRVVLIIFLLYGYIFGRMNSWFMYSPLRSELRKQKKDNKTLNIEQEKLNKTVDNLKQDIVGLKEQAKKDLISVSNSEKSKLKAWFAKFKKNKTEN